MGLDKTAEELLHEQRQVNVPKPGRPSKQPACKAKLKELLKDGDRPQSEVMELLQAEEFGESTIREAKKQLGVKSIGKGKNTRWHLHTESTDSDVENAD